MKLLTSFVIFFISIKTEKMKQNLRPIALQEALKSIVEVLSDQNHLVSIVLSKQSSDNYNPVLFGLTSAIPHTVASIRKETGIIKISSSAILILHSVASLNMLNQLTTLPSTFSM